LIAQVGFAQQQSDETSENARINSGNRTSASSSSQHDQSKLSLKPSIKQPKTVTFVNDANPSPSILSTDSDSSSPQHCEVPAPAAPVVPPVPPKPFIHPPTPEFDWDTIYESECLIYDSDFEERKWKHRLNKYRREMYPDYKKVKITMWMNMMDYLIRMRVLQFNKID
jgi:hypothetical protein